MFDTKILLPPSEYRQKKMTGKFELRVVPAKEKIKERNERKKIKRKENCSRFLSYFFQG